MNEIEIFNKKSFKDLIQDIYENSSEKKDQIQQLIAQLVSLIKRTEDVVLIGPVVKDLLDVSVKNDDQLVKLASVLQRLMGKSSTEDAGLLSEFEKQQLIESLQDAADELQGTVDDIQTDTDTLGKKASQIITEKN